jgi:regulator of replication initiation timing
VKISPLLFSLVFCLSVTIVLRAQDPGAQQDAEAAREKILKASDELDNIEANSESTRQAVDGMKADVVKLQADVASLQADNGALKQQVADLQAALDKSEAAHAKERQVLLDSVAEMIAAGKKSGTKSSAKKKDSTATAAAPIAAVKPPDAETGPTPAAVADSGDSTAAPAAGDNSAPSTAPVKTEKGYYHVVASGETLTLISNAYREEGVNVSVSDIQNANGLTDKSILKVGQKLFIPKPGT